MHIDHELTFRNMKKKVVRRMSVKLKETLERFTQESQEISSDRFRTVVGKRKEKKKGSS